MIARIVQPGMFTTIQDLGRPGFADLGVPRSGAADPIALRAGNAIVGNEPGAASLEITMLGPTVSFDHDAVVAIAGAADATIAGMSVPCWTPIALSERTELKIARVVDGVRAYLCVRGGFGTPLVMASRSTLVSAAFGGVDGKPIAAGQTIPVGRGSSQTPTTAAALIAEARDVAARRTVRICPGPHSGLFGPRGLARLAEQVFTVSSRSDRSGIRLTEPLADASRVSTGRMVSEGMMPGAIQITPSGEPIILGPDGPTTGGYPVIAVVAAVDVATLGQLPPRAALRFEPVSVEHARMLYRERLARIGHP